MRGSPDEAFARLATELSESETVAQTAAQIVDFAMATVSTQFAGITLLRRHGQFETMGASDPAVVQADDLQYQLSEGPCVDASTPWQMVLATDLTTDDRWPRWGPGAARLGFLSVLSAELRAGGRRIGAINLYGSSVRQFTEQDADVARLFAHHASAALAAAHLREGLQNALHTRTLIGQAQGILMERLDVDPDGAFTILRRYSQEQNIKLTSVAQTLVDTSALPTPPVAGQIGY